MDTEILQLKETALFYDVDIPAKMGSQYTAQDKCKAALFYSLYGNLNRVAKLLNIPQRTLYDWYKTEWWDKLTNRIRQQNKDELNANYGRMLEKTLQVVENQLENGEVKALDAAKIHGIMFDKRQILNNMPTSIAGKSKDISDLAEEFNRFIEAKTINITATETEQTD